MAKKKYFPNNWQEWKDTPENMFLTHTHDEIMTWKVHGWELPSSVFCIIRVSNLKTGKVEELDPYSKVSAAEAKVFQLNETPNLEVTIASHDRIACFRT